MPQSDAFVAGYNRALSDWEEAESKGVKCEFRNPFPVGSEEDRGYEDATYDLTQK